MNYENNIFQIQIGDKYRLHLAAVLQYWVETWAQS